MVLVSSNFDFWQELFRHRVTQNLCHCSLHTFNPTWVQLKHFDALLPAKINKMWNFYFSGTTFHRDSKPAPLDLACLNPINMHYSNHVNVFFPVKFSKMWNFWLFAELPLTIKINKICQFVQGKSVWKGLTIYTYKILGMPIANHYVRTWLDKHFFQLFWFSVILTGMYDSEM